jgi:gluconate 2-dehydrogenase gamma chain
MSLLNQNGDLEMPDEKDELSRRQAFKVIAVGVGTAGTLQIIDKTALAQEHAHRDLSQEAKPEKPRPRFFTAEELATITIISDLVIPTDERSPGAKEAGVPEFIDLMVSESSDEIKAAWREGLKAIDEKSQRDCSTNFRSATPEQQIALLKEISKNEGQPKNAVESFFRRIKNLTIDGYYTSEIGIHKDLRYQGNAYLKEFKGCTHPEHQA